MTFHEAYLKANTGGDLDKAIEEFLPISEQEVLIKALEKVREHTGLDMRQVYLYSVLRGMEIYRKEKKNG